MEEGSVVFAGGALAFVAGGVTARTGAPAWCLRTGRFAVVAGRVAAAGEVRVDKVTTPVRAAGDVRAPLLALPGGIANEPMARGCGVEARTPRVLIGGGTGKSPACRFW